jgi:hypothetical protein
MTTAPSQTVSNKAIPEPGGFRGGNGASRSRMGVKLRGVFGVAEVTILFPCYWSGKRGF